MCNFQAVLRAARRKWFLPRECRREVRACRLLEASSGPPAAPAKAGANRPVAEVVQALAGRTISTARRLRIAASATPSGADSTIQGRQSFGCKTATWRF
jgi:hypothetical protein